jgi:hypothetical protein
LSINVFQEIPILSGSEKPLASCNSKIDLNQKAIKSAPPYWKKSNKYGALFYFSDVLTS